MTKALPDITSPGAVRGVFEEMKAKGGLQSPGKGNLLGLKALGRERLRIAQEDEFARPSRRF